MIACGSDPKPTPTQIPEDACDGSCPSGFRCLEEGVCTNDCESDDECDDGYYCGVIEGEDQSCIESCFEGMSTASVDYACIENRYVPCDDVEEGASCYDCGCPLGSTCRSDSCVPDVPPALLGEPCERDNDCESDNCSRILGTCNVAIGDSCDATNCDSCVVYDDWSYCTRYCDAGDPCTAEQFCFGSTDVTAPGYRCYERCGREDDNDCPVPCEETTNPDPAGSNGDVFYCQCWGCDRLEPLRALGQKCWFDDHCESGTCVHATFSQEGWCMTECTDDAACEDGALCIANMCMTECASLESCFSTSECVAANKNDQTVMVCDPRAENGARCSANEECRSGSCSDGECRGTAASGEACMNDADCATGRCCDDACRAAC